MGLDVHWALQQIYDRLNNAHSINSFDDPASGPGFPIDAHIHYGNSSNDRDNAYWDGTNDVLLFGDGDTDFRPLASVDVVAHEYGHGITDFQVGWGSTGDQGAFNEGMSDVWGALMEHRINPGNVWRIGEQLTLTADCLRDLQNTNSSNAKNKIADTYGSSQYNGTSDKYVKSGVLSHWAYLLANGGSGTNGASNGYNVQGVGMDLLEDLIVTAVFNNFLDNTTSYAQVRTGMINAAKSLCSNQYGFLVQQVENAWYAVNVGSASPYMFITGPPHVCPNATFSVTNMPSGSTVSWSSSNTSMLSINSSSGVATRIGDGQVTITATFSGNCGNLSLTKTVTVGAPVATIHVNGQPTQNGYFCAGTSQNIDALPFDANNSYSWSLNPGSSGSLSPFGYTATFNDYISECSGISLQISNGCGTLNTGLTLCSQNCFSAYTVYPNPAKDYLTIKFDNTESADVLPERIALHSEKSTIAVLSVSVQEVYNKNEFKGDDKIELDVRELPRGMYYLHVIPKEGTEQKIEKIRILLE